MRNQAKPMGHQKKTIVFSAVFTLLSVVPVVQADDIEVFSVANNKPQILLLLDYSNSMAGRLRGETDSKIDILKRTMSTVIDNNRGKVEFGLGPMFAMSSGGVQWPISDPEADASTIDDRIPFGQKKAFEVMKDIINETDIQFGTATVPSLVEAARYFQGGPVELGGVRQDNTMRFKPAEWNAGLEKFDNFDIWSASPAAYEPKDAYSTGTAPDSTGYCKQYGRNRGAQYCTDFARTNCSNQSDVLDYQLCEYEHDDEWRGANYISPIENSCQANYIVLVSDGKPYSAGHFTSLEQILESPYSDCEDLGGMFRNGRQAGNCGPEVASYLFANNMQSHLPNTNVITHTVGFSLDAEGTEYLEKVADFGGGDYFPADTAQELEEAINDIVDESVKQVGQFVNFAVDVDRGTFTHDNRVYIPMFQPSASKYWSGNVKGYYLDKDGLKDVNNLTAGQSDADGFLFSEESQSFWSPSADGNLVAKGGASDALVPPNRNLLTFTGSAATLPAIGVPLSAAQHALTRSNSLVSSALLGTSGDRSTLLDWIREQPMGAPLHSNAVVANYPDNKRVIFAMTNQGFLHAIDGTYPTTVGDVQGGEELFAFMPKELLPNIEYMMNSSFPGEHLYGLDGQITPWHTDNNDDGIVNGSDKLILIFGMRRGGSHYYALDVTDTSNPRLMWQISGGSGDFAKLGQSWSKPALITVKSRSTTERVLIFGGGYDDSLDDLKAARSATGNTVFLVDKAGDLVWSASHSAMQYAIPSDVTAIDSDSDGVADRAYVGDLGGQVWRIDFDDVRDSSSFLVSHFADLSGQGYRPIFYRPSVSRETSYGPFSIAVGAGNRDNPLSDYARGALYLLTDANTESLDRTSDTPVTLTNDMLIDATNEIAVSSSALDTSNGWYVQLEPGEKSLSPPLTVEGKLLATTFLPPETEHDPNSCTVADSTGRLYVLGVDSAGSGVGSEADPSTKYVPIEGFGIPPGPSVVFAKDSDQIQIYVGNEEQIGIDPTLKTVFWHSK